MNKKLKVWKRLDYKSGDLFLIRRSETLRRARGYKQYKSVQEQLQKIDTKYVRSFENAKRQYEEEY